MKKTTMRRLTAAVAAICMCAMAAMPMMAGADSLTIKDSTNVKVAGKTFTAYKLFSLTKNGESYDYIINGEWKAFFVDYMATANANETVATETKAALKEKYNAMNADEFSAAVATFMNGLGGNNSAKVQALAEALKAEVSNKEFNTTYTVAQTATAGDDDISVELDFAVGNDAGTGYYLVLETSDIGDNDAKSAVILDTTKTEEITLKADKPTIEKKIWEPTPGETADATIDDSELVDANNAYIGETVHYVIDSTVPNTTYYDAYTYKITDTLSSGLKDPTNIVVTAGDGVTLTAGDAYAAGVDYKVTTNTTDDGTTIEILFWNFLETLSDHSIAADSEIRVTYDATVDTDAVIGIKGNPNKVDLTYSNDPSVSSDGWYDETTNDKTDPDHPNYDDDDDDTNTPPPTPTTSKTPEDIVITYLTEMELVKVDDSANPVSLAGAVFSIESNTDQTQYYVEVAKIDDQDVATVTEVTKDTTTGKYEVEVDSYGKLVLTGLAAGTYTITEVKAPENYNKLTTPITVVIDWTDPETVDSVDDTCEWKFTRYNGAANAANKVEETTIKSDSATQTYSFNVINRKGTLFPSTGGIGTTVFTVTGLTLMLGAAGMYIVKRRASSK